MATVYLTVFGSVFEVSAPVPVAQLIAGFFQLCVCPKSRAAHRCVVADSKNDGLSLTINGTVVSSKLTNATLLSELAKRLANSCNLPANRQRIHAAAVGWTDKAILIAGEAGAGKSTLAAWLIEKGFSYIADDEVVIDNDDAAIMGFPAPLRLHSPAIQDATKWQSFRTAPSVQAGEAYVVQPNLSWAAAEASASCGMIVQVQYRANAALHMEVVPPVKAAFTPINNSVPILLVSYGEFSQLDGVLDTLLRLAVESGIDNIALDRLLSGIALSVQGRVVPAGEGGLVPGFVDGQAAVADLPLVGEPRQTLAATPPHDKKKFAIGMATYDDYDGVYFSIQAIRMFHAEVCDDVEFIVIDNNPLGKCAEALKNLEKTVPNYRYVPLDTTGNASRDFIFQEATGEFVLCMDCHVFFAAGSLKKLFAYFKRHPKTADMLQGPLIYDDLKNYATHFDPKWRGGMFGTWGVDPRGANAASPPFEIGMQGVGAFACRRAAWPGYNKNFKGFCVEEGYVHEKFRRNGGKVLCLPFLRWMHRFARPNGVPYRNIWEDRVRNYLIAYDELGFETDGLKTHMTELLGAVHIERMFNDYKQEFQKR